MGQKQVLTDVTFTDTSLPILRDDIGLTAGSLALFDMNHSAVTNSGTPANGASIHNVAYKQAADIIGSGDAASLQFSFTNTFTSTEGKFQRTSKKALHGIVSLTNQGGHGASINLSSALMAYLTANTSRPMALFIWANVTRIASNISNLRDVGIVNYASAASNFLFNTSIANILGPTRNSYSAPTGWTGTSNSNSALNGSELFAWGNTGGYNGLNPNNGRSSVLYRAHLIDVTESGKTFAQLDAADAALYASFFASGGRYYGDTWSNDPADTP